MPVSNLLLTLAKHTRASLASAMFTISVTSDTLYVLDFAGVSSFLRVSKSAHAIYTSLFKVQS